MDSSVFGIQRNKKIFLLFARQRHVLRGHLGKPDKTGKLSESVIIPQIEMPLC